MADAKKWTGAKVYIGGNAAAHTAETSWTQIKGAIAGSIGGTGTWTEIDTSAIEDVTDTSMKGTLNPGDITFDVIANIADPGQIALAAAAADGKGRYYNFKVELDDDAASAGNNPTKWTFGAHVMSFEGKPMGRNARVEKTARLSKQTETVETAAAA